MGENKVHSKIFFNRGSSIIGLNDIQLASPWTYSFLLIGIDIRARGGKGEVIYPFLPGGDMLLT